MLLLCRHLYGLLSILIGLLVAVSFGRAAVAADSNRARPNILIILVDDMGFADLGCYGSEIPTPNIDRLAATGLRFTQFYNTGRCCPTRAALLTGLYSHEAGVGHMIEDRGAPGYLGHLNDRCVTIAQVLGEAGYFTAMTGKWHVGQNHGVTPWNRGFQRSLSAPVGGFYYAADPGAVLDLNGRRLALDDPALPKDWYTTDLWTDYGIKFIDEARAAKKPWLLYLAHNAPHFPLQAPQDEIAKFRNSYKIGWDELRQRRHTRQIELGLLDPDWALSPRPPAVKAWKDVTPTEQDRFDHIMAIYAACIAQVDIAVGRLVAALKERDQLDNTLILLLSDNGANAESGPNGRLEGDQPGGPRSIVFEGQSWATLSNTPLRRYKHFNHEGGIATPLVAHWPAGIAAKGEFRQQVGHVIDIMATCVDLAGAKYPTELGGKKILPMEGKSLMPAFADKPIERDAIYWAHEGNAAIRVGNWKLVRMGLEGAWELYDLNADRTELHNVAAQEPKRAAELLAKWNAWAKRTNVLPYPKGVTDADSGAK
jgi:arylsulfatase